MIPTTFKEYLQLLYSRFILGAGVALGIGVAAIIAILVWGGWPADLYELIIKVLGGLAFGGGLSMTLIIIFLGLGGPARSMSLKYKDAEISAQGDDECE